MGVLALVAAGCDNDTKLHEIKYAPEATIQSPSDGTELMDGEAITLRGLVSDANTLDTPETLLVTWLAGSNNVEGCTDLTPTSSGDTTCEWEAVAETETITLSVRDSGGSVGTADVSIAVLENTAPSISLCSPEASGDYYIDIPVELCAAVSDAEDVPTDLVVRWEDALGDALAEGGPDSTGAFRQSVSLSEGRHTLSATVTDTSGAFTGSSSVTITVNGLNTAPECAFISPSDGSGHPFGADVAIEALISDAETAPTSLDVSLTDSLDGVYTGSPTVTSTGELTDTWAGLSVGAHTLSLTVRDARNETYTCATSFTVCDAVWYLDDDGDGFGDPGTSTISCEQPIGYVAEAGDCDDTDSDVSPGAAEVCNDIDDDCDGDIDDDDSDITTGGTYYADVDGDGYGDPASSVDACEQPSGYVLDNTDCDDTDSSVSPGEVEVCNDIDDDCDGDIDGEDSSISDEGTFYADADGDGYGDADDSVTACEAPSDYVSDDTDCDDADSGVNPGEVEVCDADDTDEDCDGVADDSSASGQTTYYDDDDGDGYGDPDDSTDSCEQPSGSVENSDDCDDTDSAVSPDTEWYFDYDGDGYGDPGYSPRSSCEQPSGYVDNEDDCDDTDSGISPAAGEVCDEVDNDCDGDIDDADDSVDTSGGDTYYADDDGDGDGDTGDSVDACEQPSGYVDNDDDCDDSDADLHSGTVWYYDSDSDGYGGASSTTGCSQPSGFVDNSDDCDDREAAASPDEPEVCDSIDNDCDGDTDEGVQTTYYADSDGDGYGDSSDTTTACEEPPGYVSDDTDCVDADALRYPGAPELCDGVQDDCDDSGWTSDAGIVSWYDDATAAWSDASSTFSAGTASSPASITLGDAGLLNVCAGTWYANLTVEADVDIVGVDGASLVVLNGGGADSVVTVQTDAITVGLSGLTITNGEATQTTSSSSSTYLHGGGVFCDASADLVLDGAVITDNHAEVGGGLSSDGCDVVAEGVTWSDNSADVHSAGASARLAVWEESGGRYEGNEAPSSGGARYYSSDVTLVDTVYHDNVASTGGAAAFHIGYTASLDATGLTVTSNRSGTNASGGEYYGGAVWLYSDVTATIEDATFSDNDSDNITGAMYLYSSDVSCTDCTFDNNTAIGAGGAVFVRTDSTFSMDGEGYITNNASSAYGGGILLGNSVGSFSGVTFSGNEAASYGGAAGFIASSTTSASVTITDCTFSGNSSDTYGGGIFANHAELDVSSTTISGNTSVDEGGGVYLAAGADAVFDTCDFEDNVATGDGGGIYTDTADTLWVFDSTFSANEGSTGGAIACYDNDCAVDDSTFTGNHGVLYAGAINMSGGDLQLSDATIEDNTGGRSNGGVRFDGASTSGTIDGCTFEGNQSLDAISNGGGGALVVRYGATVEVSDTDFLDNTTSVSSGTSYGGGALWAWSTGGTRNTITFDGVTFDGNTSDARGGVAFISNSDVTMTDVVMSDNEADSWGGALYVYGTVLDLDTVEITGNTADDDGGGIYFDESTFTIDTCEFTGNTSTTGDGGAFYVDHTTGDVITSAFDMNSPHDTYHQISADVDNWSRTGSTFSCTTTSCY